MISNFPIFSCYRGIFLCCPEIFLWLLIPEELCTYQCAKLAEANGLPFFYYLKLKDQMHDAQSKAPPWGYTSQSNSYGLPDPLPHPPPPPLGLTLLGALPNLRVATFQLPTSIYFLKHYHKTLEGKIIILSSSFRNKQSIV